MTTRSRSMPTLHALCTVIASPCAAYCRYPSGCILDSRPCSAHAQQQHVASGEEARRHRRQGAIVPSRGENVRPLLGRHPDEGPQFTMFHEHVAISVAIRVETCCNTYCMCKPFHPPSRSSFAGSDFGRSLHSVAAESTLVCKARVLPRQGLARGLYQVAAEANLTMNNITFNGSIQAEMPFAKKRKATILAL